MIEGKLYSIKDVFDVVSGSTPSTSKSEYWNDGDIQWITPKDLSSLKTPYINFTERNITQAGLRSCSAHIIPKNSIIVSSRAPIGYVAILNQAMSCNQGCKALIPKNGNVDSLFAYYLMNTKVDEMNRLGSGSTFKEISKSKLETIKIKLPDLKTQQIIAHILEQADAARQKRKQANQLTEQFLQSAFLEMFGDPVRNEKGWEVDALGNHTDVITKGETPLWKGDKYVDHGILFIRSENVLAGKIDLSKKTFIPEMVHRRMTRSQLKKNDVLLNIVGASIGRAGIFSEDREANINQAIAIIRLKKTLLPVYVCSFLNSPFSQIVYSDLKAGVARDNLNLTQMRDFKMVIPPLPLQQKFASLVEQVEEMKIKQRKSEKNLDNLFQSLMQKYFG